MRTRTGLTIMLALLAGCAAELDTSLDLGDASDTSAFMARCSAVPSLRSGSANVAASGSRQPR